MSERVSEKREFEVSESSKQETVYFEKWVSEWVIEHVNESVVDGVSEW